MSTIINIYSAILGASNGLFVDTDTIKLGGSLIEPTTITTDVTNTLAIAGLQSGSTSDRLVISDPSTGVLKYIDSSSFIYTSDNGITLNGNNFQLGGPLVQNTTITNGGFDLTFAQASSRSIVVGNDGTFSAFNASASPSLRYSPIFYNGAAGVGIAALGTSITPQGTFHIRGSVTADPTFNSFYVEQSGASTGGYDFKIDGNGKGWFKGRLTIGAGSAFPEFLFTNSVGEKILSAEQSFVHVGLSNIYSTVDGTTVNWGGRGLAFKNTYISGNPSFNFNGDNTSNSTSVGPLKHTRFNGSVTAGAAGDFGLDLLDLSLTVNHSFAGATGVARSVYSNLIPTSVYNYRAFEFTSSSAFAPNAAVTDYYYSAITPKINASVNNQTITGLDITLSGSDGAFTGVARYALRLTGGSLNVANLAGTGTRITSSTPDGTQSILSGTGVIRMTGTTVAFDTTVMTSEATAGYLPYMTSASAVANSVIYQSGTNVGIGITSPESKFQISGGDFYIDRTSKIQFWAGTGASRSYITSNLTNDLLFNSSVANIVTIKGDGTGYSGFGKSNPGSTVDVNGQIRALYTSGFQLDNGSGTMQGRWYKSGSSVIMDRIATTDMVWQQAGVTQMTLVGSTGNLVASASIQTGNPTGGTAQAMRFGSVTTVTDAALTAIGIVNQQRVQIGATVYYIPLSAASTPWS